ncbi:MAG: hypothetical protein GF375_04735 [Candidatus Omnitrophica bacterium]|nr:hypothetical protein [Candidatus Omnitrophota bacterium]MBD3269333.1 hypothetical protein [Candidatus Omnitrophota bacterium]
MKRISFFLLLIFLGLSVYGQSNESYEEIWLSGRRVINGLTRQQALDEFGEPSRVGPDFWHYSGEDPFYVYFSDDETNFFIFPFTCEAKLGVPFQLKAFISYPDFKMEEITPYVNWIVTSSKLLYLKGNYFFPLEEGSSQVIAEYKGKMSNACNVAVSIDTEETQEQELLSLHVFPDKPAVVVDEIPTFLAFGVFRNRGEKKFFAKDISSNVEWFVSHGGEASAVYDNTISFPTPGESRVFCRYQGLKSNAQAVEVRKEYFFKNDTIKYIHLVPDVAIADKGSEVEFKAVATTFSNRAFNIAKDLYWDVDDETVAYFDQRGVLKLSEKGVVEVEARGRGHTSFPAKVVIKESEELLKKIIRAQPPKSKQTPEDSLEERLQKIQQKPEELVSLELKPELIEMTVGDTAAFQVEAVYSNDSREDVTSLAKLEASDPAKVVVEEGRVEALLKGETEMRASFEGIKSNPSLIRIEGAKLMSIVLEPRKVKEEIGKEFEIKAVGYYGDDSQKDVTDISNWNVGNEKITKNLGKGLFKTKWLGETSITASIEEVKSLPAGVKVFISPFSIFKAVSLLLLVLLSLLSLIFYILIKRKRSDLKKFLDSEPSRSMIDIFQHSRKVLKSCGIPYESNIPPLQYAKMVEDKFSLKEGTFGDLAAKFCEAKYSSHKISAEQSHKFLKEYNDFMRLLHRKYHDRTTLSLSLFIRRQPLVL